MLKQGRVPFFCKGETEYFGIIGLIFLFRSKMICNPLIKFHFFICSHRSPLAGKFFNGLQTCYNLRETGSIAIENEIRRCISSDYFYRQILEFTPFFGHYVYLDGDGKLTRTFKFYTSDSYSRYTLL